MTKKKAPKRQWVYSPKSLPKPKVPEDLKAEVARRSDELVETTLKPEYVKPPENMRFNYVVDLFTKWFRSFFYFCATYRCPAENCISEFFEVRFARLEYAGEERFHLAYMRYTGEWWQIYENYTLDECLSAIKDEPHFRP